MKTRRFLVFAALAVSLIASAQQHPNQQKGFDPAKLYQFDSIDSINQFNGNLVLTIPLGQKYPVSNNLSYGFTLVYNGNPWDYTWTSTTRFLAASPTTRTNAGLGWLLSLGRLISPDDPSNETHPFGTTYNHAFVYESPDGADHIFGSQQYPAFALDDSNLRLMEEEDANHVVVAMHVQFPDGTEQVFKDRPNGIPGSTPDWRLVEMKDPSGNHMTVTYSQAGKVWTISDSTGRQHVLTFKTLTPLDGVTVEQTVLERMLLDGFQGQTGLYQFEYATTVLNRPPPDNTGDVNGNTTGPPYTVALLAKVILPSGETYSMLDREGNAAYDRTGYTTGALRSLRLPTLGRLAWDWTGFEFPEGSTLFHINYPGMTIDDIPPPTARKVAIGVYKRYKYDEGDHLIGAWRYFRLTSSPFNEPCTSFTFDDMHDRWVMAPNFTSAAMAAILIEPSTDPADLDCHAGCPTTISYHSIYPHGELDCGENQNTHHFSNVEYGLSVDRYLPQDGRFLSMQKGMLKPASGPVDWDALFPRSITINGMASVPGFTLQQTKYAAFDDAVNEHHYETSNRIIDAGGNGFTETFNRSYDRTRPKVVVSGGTIGGSPRYKTTFVGYEPVASNATNWTLNRYTEKCSAEYSLFPGAAGEPAKPASCSDLFGTSPDSSAMTTACFEPATGYLLGTRTRATPSAETSSDVVTLYGYDQGNVAKEAWFGGNGASSLPASLCTFNPSQSTYQYEYGYENGSLSYARTFLGSNLWLYTLKQSIDRHTGLPESVWDAATADANTGFRTDYEYDETGRLKKEVPQGTTAAQSPKGAVTTYLYKNAVASPYVPAAVEVTKTTNDGAVELAKSEFRFDSLGRLFEQSQTLPGVSAPSVQRTVFYPHGPKWKVSELEQNPQHLTVFEYDGLGRVTKTTAPDGGQTTYVYSGSASMTRTTPVAQGHPLQLVEATTTEAYDSFGRLTKVTDGAGSVASYTYDVMDHLRSVDMGSGHQSRTFDYDGRGFLTGETHPESNPIKYSDFDAKGHAHRKDVMLDATHPAITLLFDLDGAERVTRVSDANHVLKEYTYDRLAGAPDTWGRLMKSVRHNYLPGGDRIVSESFEYGGPRLSLTSKKTEVTTAGSPAVTFTQQITRDEMELPAKISYPAGVVGSGSGAIHVGPARDIENTRALGMLTGVAERVSANETKPLATIGYAENGTIASVAHANGVTDTIEIDPNHMKRPRSISFAGGNNICQIPGITQQPVNTSAPAGQTATVHVQASGNGISYQWYKGVPGNAAAVAGQTTDNLTITVATTTAGSYFVRLTNTCGSVDSNPISIDIGCTPLTVISSTNEVEIESGGSVTLFANVSGSINSYVWSRWVDSTGAFCEPGSPGSCHAALVSEQHGPSLVIDNVTTGQWYDVVVRPQSSCGDPEITIRMHVDPIACSASNSNFSFTAQPQSVIAAVADATAHLSMSFTPSNADVTWERRGLDIGDWTVIAGETGWLLDVKPAYTTSYRAHVKSKPGSSCQLVDRYSDEATVHVMSCGEITITAQPADQRVVEGSSAHLDFAATTPLLQYYTWYSGQSGDTSHALGSDRNSTFTTPPLTEDADFWVRVAGSSCGIDSRTVHVSVCHPPSVSHSPTSAIMTPGEDKEFAVDAHGSGLHYQWFMGPLHDPAASTPIGYDSRTVHVTISETKTIWVRVTGECGSADSEAATATYCVPPAFITVPADQVVLQGTQPTLTVAVDQQNVHYTWYVRHPGSDDWIEFGGDAPSAQIPALQAGMAAVRVLARNDLCPAYSRIINLDVCVPPFITLLAGDQYSTAGQPVLLTSATDQGASVTRTWFEGPVGDRSKVISGEPNHEVAPDTTTSYWLEASNGRCSSRTDAQTVYVCRPRFETQPQSQTFVQGVTNSIQLSFVAKGTPPMAYQWYLGTSGDKSHPIAGATSPDLAVTPSTTTSYWAEASCACPITYSAATSATATVTYCVPPHPDTPVAVNVTNGDPLTLTVTGIATATNPHYHWYQGVIGDVSAPLAGDVVQMAIPPLNVAPKYWVHVTGDCGMADVQFNVNICYPPAITQQPASTTITDGQTTTLTVATSATGVTYQWYQGTWPDSSHAVGTNSLVFTTPALTATTSYWVRLTGACSSSSTTATVTVCTRPVITQQPANQNGVTTGTPITLSVVATPSNPNDTLRYDWYAGASGNTSQQVAMNGSSSVVVTPLSTTSYWVRVTGGSCYRDSAAAVVDVCVPKITTQPQDASTVQGTPVTLSVAATGTTPLTYQWFNGASGNTSSPVAGATGSSATVTPSGTATYWVQVKSPCSTTNSGVASRTTTVTVCIPATVTTQPANVNITLGQSATLTVAATGTNPHYAWFAGPSGNTTTPLGSTSSTLTFSPTSTTTVWARATADCGAPSNSTAATVDVCIPPAISTQPSDRIIQSGTTTTFTVVASGTNLTYQWYRGENTDTSNPISGATAASYTTPALTSDTRYWVNVISKGRCSTKSSSALAQICVPPSIAISPQSANIASGQSVILSVGAGWSSYAWYTGATGNTSSGVISTAYYYDAHPTTTTSYWVRVGNGYCTSDATATTVSVCLPSITAQPVSRSIAQTTSTTLSVTANGATSYQWYVGNSGTTTQPVSGATASSVTVTPNSTTSYWVKVSGNCGSANSQTATVTVTPCTQPTIQTQPQPVTIQQGASAALSTTATGTNLTYQWYKSDPAGSSFVAVTGATSPTISIAPSGSQANFYVIVSNACGTRTSNTVMITTVTCVSPSITQQPVNYTFQQGSPAIFTVGATGTNLRYQWYKSDPAGSTFVAVTGGTSQTLSIMPVSAQANYYVRVTGDCGTPPTSVTVTATRACDPVSIYSQPQSTTINAGQMVLLGTDASGTNPQYGWFESTDGIHFSGYISTSPGVYVAPNVTTYYYCSVWNDCSNASSDVISVQVIGGSGARNQQPASTTHPRTGTDSAGFEVAAPRITAQPLSQTIAPQGTATLSIDADSGSYQWFIARDGEEYAPIAGATDAILTASPSERTHYFARVTNTWASINSQVATVSVAPSVPASPAYRSISRDVVFAPGSPVLLEVRATGPDLHYAWFKSDPASTSPLKVGTDSPRLTDSPTGARALYYVRIYNGSDFIDTETILARASTCDAPAITAQPQRMSVTRGQPASLQVAAAAPGNVTYTWYVSDENQIAWSAVEAGNSATLTVSPNETRFYFCVITSACGAAVTSNSAVVEVTP